MFNSIVSISASVVMNIIVVLLATIRSIAIQLIIGCIVGIIIMTMSSAANAATTLTHHQGLSNLFLFGLVMFIGSCACIWSSINEGLEWSVTIIVFAIALVAMIVGFY